ncbi:MAG: glycosyltransferase [Solirubrobacterales bacterium]
MLALELVFWAAACLLVYTHFGYPLVLRLLVGLRGERPATTAEPDEGDLPAVSLLIAAHDEAGVIEARVADARRLDYPAGRLQVIIASDGSADRTVELAERAGADVVLDLPRAGKVAALNAAAEVAHGDVLAFSDANTTWEPYALRRLVARFAEPDVGYVCGAVRFDAPDGDNQEGVYWRYEMAVRALESRLAGITAGNGAINAVRREAYVFLPPGRGQDVCFPFLAVKAGWRPVYEPAARAREPMAATIGDERERKRRMMSGAWATMLGGGMLSPRGYGPLYAFEIVSHRLLRYSTPLLHLVALAANIALLGEGWVYAATLAVQALVLVAAGLGGWFPARPLRIARYYVAVTAASAAGLWDHLRRRVPKTWEQAGGTRQ